MMRVELPVPARRSLPSSSANFVRTRACVQHRRRRRVGGMLGRQLAAGLDVGEHQRRDVVAVGPAITTSRT